MPSPPRTLLSPLPTGPARAGIESHCSHIPSARQVLSKYLLMNLDYPQSGSLCPRPAAAFYPTLPLRGTHPPGKGSISPFTQVCPGFFFWQFPQGQASPATSSFLTHLGCHFLLEPSPVIPAPFLSPHILPGSGIPGLLSGCLQSVLLVTSAPCKPFLDTIHVFHALVSLSQTQCPPVVDPQSYVVA